jgi:hypothetical protein
MSDKKAFDIVRICGVDFRRWKDGGTSTEALVNSAPFGMMWKTVPDAIARIIFADQEALAKLRAELEEAREIINDYWTRTAQRARMEGILQQPEPKSIQGRARAFLDKAGK